MKTYILLDSIELNLTWVMFHTQPCLENNWRKSRTEKYYNISCKLMSKKNDIYAEGSSMKLHTQQWMRKDYFTVVVVTLLTPVRSGT